MVGPFERLVDAFGAIKVECDLTPSDRVGWDVLHLGLLPYGHPVLHRRLDPLSLVVGIRRGLHVHALQGSQRRGVCERALS